MSLKDKGNIITGMKNKVVAIPEGVSFDGVTDYMSRSTDLVGNVDSKTFTFSCWVYWDGKVENRPIVYFYNSVNGRETFRIYISSVGGIHCSSWDDAVSTATYMFEFSNFSPVISAKTWTSIVVSVDLNDTTKRNVYVNDNILTVSWDNWTNSPIPNTLCTSIDVASAYGGSCQERLSHIFLDYIYRDLSIVSNRRLFITADGKPAGGLETLNPILYLPMKDKATAHLNSGTGGDFVQNGLIETADRGANQDNCVMSSFDGVDDYLSNTISVTSTRTLTVSMIVNDYVGVAPWALTNNLDTNYVRPTRSVWGNSGTTTVQANYDAQLGSISVLSYSFDVTDTTKRSLFINGVKQPDSVFVTYVNQDILFTNYLNDINIGIYGTSFFNGSIGELYFDTTYTDLATKNPFWNSATNKPIPVRKAIADNGLNPIIAMPLDASNITKNYGTGGDFTWNDADASGTKGARGASEYISRSALKESDSYLTNSITAPDSKTFSFVIAFRNVTGTKHKYFGSAGVTNFEITSDNNVIKVSQNLDLNGTVGQFYWALNGVENDSSLHLVLLSVDTANGNYICYEDGVDNGIKTDINGVVDTTSIFDLDSGGFDIFDRSINLTNIMSLYFTTDYIDFSQESNRNLFVNQLGYPRDLTPLIADGVIPNPLAYLPFNDTANLGKNYGNGVDFTTVGVINKGADFAI